VEGAAVDRAAKAAKRLRRERPVGERVVVEDEDAAVVAIDHEDVTWRAFAERGYASRARGWVEAERARRASPLHRPRARARVRHFRATCIPFFSEASFSASGKSVSAFFICTSRSR